VKGHLRKRGPGAWALIVELGRDAEGKRRQKWHTFHGNKKDAEAELTRLLHELNTGMYAEPDKMLVRDYLDRWLKDYAKPNVAPRTYERYQELVEGNLVPAIGHLPLTKLRPLHIQAMEVEALANGRKVRGAKKTKDKAPVSEHDKTDEKQERVKPGLSARTVLHMHRVLRSALQQAVRWQLLSRNPCDAVKPPRPERTEVKALDEKQTAQLLQATVGARLYIPVLVAVTTGMRRGEILGLQWQDVDLEASTLRVRQTLGLLKSGPTYAAPKSEKSCRVVSLPTITSEALKEHRRAQAARRLALGPVWHDHDLVCPGEDGRPWHPGTFSHLFQHFARRVGVDVTFHGLRHTHATQLLRAGVHVKIVSERLGHSTIALTLDTYSHVLPGMQEDAAARVDAALRTAFSGLSRGN